MQFVDAHTSKISWFWAKYAVFVWFLCKICYFSVISMRFHGTCTSILSWKCSFSGKICWFRAIFWRVCIVKCTFFEPEMLDFVGYLLILSLKCSFLGKICSKSTIFWRTHPMKSLFWWWVYVEKSWIWGLNWEKSLFFAPNPPNPPPIGGIFFSRRLRNPSPKGCIGGIFFTDAQPFGPYTQEIGDFSAHLPA